MANSSGIFATNSTVGTNNITGTTIATNSTVGTNNITGTTIATNSTVGTNNITGTTIASDSFGFNPSYDLNSDTVYGVPVCDFHRMSYDQQRYFVRKWEDGHRAYESRSRQEQAPVKGPSSGYLDNKTLLLLEI